MQVCQEEVTHLTLVSVGLLFTILHYLAFVLHIQDLWQLVVLLTALQGPFFNICNTSIFVEVLLIFTNMKHMVKFMLGILSLISKKSTSFIFDLLRKETSLFFHCLI